MRDPLHEFCAALCEAVFRGLLTGAFCCVFLRLLE